MNTATCKHTWDKKDKEYTRSRCTSCGALRNSGWHFFVYVCQYPCCLEHAALEVEGAATARFCSDHIQWGITAVKSSYPRRIL